MGAKRGGFVLRWEKKNNIPSVQSCFTWGLGFCQESTRSERGIRNEQVQESDLDGLNKIWIKRVGERGWEKRSY